VKQQRWR